MKAEKDFIDDSSHPVCSNAALLISHPGHELRVYGWMEKVQPRVFVLTDGSGRSGKSRLASTSKVLERVRCESGTIYGRFSDVEVYAKILRQDFEFFTELSEQLCAAIVDHGFDLVVGDAIEWYNSIHDVWRLVINCAVDMANRRTGSRRVANYDFLLVGSPESFVTGADFEPITLRLSDAVWGRKLAAARGYSELADEVESSFERFGIEAFDKEFLRSVPRSFDIPVTHAKPFYEIYGEKQVAAGYYKEVIRYREHVLPLAEALMNESRGDG